jgi:hypothetical protein
MSRPSNNFFFSRFGLVEFPVEGDQVTDEQLYSVLDPLLDKMLRLFRAAINQELGQAIDSVVATSVWAAVRTGTKLATALPVADVLYTAPTPQVVLSSKYKFPLLCCYREGGDAGEFSLALDKTADRWGVDYILGPLDPADHRRLTAAVRGVFMVLQQAIRAGAHPALDSGASQFPDGELWKLRLARWEAGPAKFGETDRGQEFFALHLALESEELIVPDESAGAAPFLGTSINVGIGGGEGGILPDVIQTRTDADVPWLLNDD